MKFFVVKVSDCFTVQAVSKEKALAEIVNIIAWHSINDMKIEDITEETDSGVAP